MELKATKIQGFKVYFRNCEELKRIRQEIFIAKEYKFSSSKKNPTIIDCGSHIGLSIIYFKSIYPDAKIIGFEPNPENFMILKKNIAVNNLKKVKVYNFALSNKKGETNIHISLEQKEPWTWGDTIIYNMWGDENRDQKVFVKTVKLSSYIKSNVDLLKMDIEGSEQTVLQEVQNKLFLVDQIIMEYHGTQTSIGINDFTVIKDILERNNFKVENYPKDLKFTFPDFVADLRETSTVFTIKAKRT